MAQDRAKLKEGGRILVHLTESHQQGENPIIVSRKGTGGNSHIYPIELKMIIVRRKQLSEKDQPQGDIQVHQLQDNRSRHQFEERVVKILSGIRAAMRGIGHICTTCILETRTYVLVMLSLGNQAFLIVGVLTSKSGKETHRV